MSTVYPREHDCANMIVFLLCTVKAEGYICIAIFLQVCLGLMQLCSNTVGYIILYMTQPDVFVSGCMTLLYVPPF